LKRDPNNIGIYSNRSAAYIKLMEFNEALKDAEKCLALDPKFVKAFVRKGTIHHLRQEYHKALQAYDLGLAIDPINKDLLEGKMKTQMAVQTSMHSKGDDEQVRHSMNDPEIQTIMRDPRIVQVLKDLQENP
jgi:stress-induced-phosphoprotein 1